MGEHQVTRAAVFLDRDGVLNRPVIRDGQPFPPATPEEFELYADVAEGCAELKQAGFFLVVVTNQPDVGRGTQSRELVEAMHRKLRDAVPSLDAIEICYHAGASYGQPCDCRKPKPGMLLRAAVNHTIDLDRSFFVGDRWRDVDCAHTAGCRSVFIDHGYSEQLRQRPEFTVATFREGVAVILRNQLSQSTRRH
jgi:D-glycero-D-manno-heptose 1,7-bisphosphate phosphatase